MSLKILIIYVIKEFCEFKGNIFYFIAAERLIRVRALGGCAAAKLQEFARIVFVDDYNTHKPRVEDQAPLTKRPTYESLEDPNASVSSLKKVFFNCLSIYFHFFVFQNLVNKLSLNLIIFCSISVLESSANKLR